VTPESLRAWARAGRDASPAWCSECGVFYGSSERDVQIEWCAACACHFDAMAAHPELFRVAVAHVQLSAALRLLKERASRGVVA
jgi:hypothetical protein